MTFLIRLFARTKSHGPSDICKYWWMHLEVACLTGIAIAPIEAPKNGWSNKIVTKMLSDVASRLDSEGGPSVFTKMQSASYFATVWALDLDVCKLVHLHCLHCSKRFLKLLA